MQFDGFQILHYRPEMAADWDSVVSKSDGGTVLHSRRFLDYHGDRFRDLSLVSIRDGQSSLSAVFPLAADPEDPELAVSHPGSSFGGIVGPARDPFHHRSFLGAAAQWLRDQGFNRLLYHCAPAELLRQADDGLQPRLIRLGRVVQLDLWSVRRLDAPTAEQGYWQSEIRSAERKGLRAEPAETPADWALLHGIIADRLDRKFGRKPVHSVAELIDLHRRLGGQSRGTLVRSSTGEALAGLWSIDYGTGTLHNQYNFATDFGLSLRASSYGISLALQLATAQGFRRFSFGRSTGDDGWSDNRDLLRFKARFGAGLASQFHIDLDLRRLAQTAI